MYSFMVDNKISNKKMHDRGTLEEAFVVEAYTMDSTRSLEVHMNTIRELMMHKHGEDGIRVFEDYKLRFEKSAQRLKMRSEEHKRMRMAKCVKCIQVSEASQAMRSRFIKKKKRTV